jgi:hypothetical protein
MKRTPAWIVLWTSMCAISGTFAQAVDMGTAFTYQGRLTREGSPLTDACDLEFSLWPDPILGPQLGSTLSVADAEVTGGLFTVRLDFGVGMFNGEARWLQIAVRCPPDTLYETLQPRTGLTPTPYALFCKEPRPGLSVHNSDWRQLHHPSQDGRQLGLHA